MSERIIDLQDWLQTDAGRYMLAWEQGQSDALVADMFGFHALQLGMPQLQGLAHNRMPHRWLAVQEPCEGLPEPEVSLAHPPALVTDFSALPFPAASLDLVLMPHSLEVSMDAHATLREVERVLVPQGRVLICGFNPVGFPTLGLPEPEVGAAIDADAGARRRRIRAGAAVGARVPRCGS